MTTQQTAVVAIASIHLHWSEFDSRENVIFKTWAEADVFVAKVRDAEAAGPGIGYCKTKWTVTWADGYHWNIRHDIEADSKGLGDEIRNEWEIYAGLRRIKWMDDAQYAAFLRDRTHPELADYLTRYALTD